LIICYVVILSLKSNYAGKDNKKFAIGKYIADVFRFSSEKIRNIQTKLLATLVRNPAKSGDISTKTVFCHYRMCVCAILRKTIEITFNVTR